MVTRPMSSADLSKLGPTQVDERLRLVKEAIRRAEGTSADNTFHPTTFKPKTVKKSFGTYGISDQMQELLEAEEHLRELLHLEGAGAGPLEVGGGGCPDKDPCAEKKTMDLERLAEMVFDRMMAEVRVEGERTGWMI